MEFAHYFLTISQIVDFARTRASCARAGLGGQLGRVLLPRHYRRRPLKAPFAVRPLHLGESGEPPDIDVDFEHERREEVIQHLYARYGRERAALCATVIHYRPRMAIREVAKALGLSRTSPRDRRHRLGFLGKDLPDSHVVQAGLDPANPALRQALRLAHDLIGFPRHLSQHVGASS